MVVEGVTRTLMAMVASAAGGRCGSGGIGNGNACDGCSGEKSGGKRGNRNDGGSGKGKGNTGGMKNGIGSSGNGNTVGGSMKNRMGRNHGRGVQNGMGGHSHGGRRAVEQRRVQLRQRRGIPVEPGLLGR
jgi:hypothetical protein